VKDTRGINLKRSDCAAIAAETLEIVARGGYDSPAGAARVELADAVERSVAGTWFLPESGWRSVRRRADEAAAKADPDHRPLIEVTDETTLEACRRLTLEAGTADVLALNFASAKNPGGGFLGGSRAQEESLARSSALYATLQNAQAYYDTNRHARDAYYTDCAIYSPAVPVFRDDAGALLDDPYQVTFVTCPAANATALRSHHKFDEQKIEDTMRRRAGNVLALAAAEGHRTVVLGAWGCGVFGNDPGLIARLFAEALREPVGRCFDRVVFAVYDTRPGQPFVAAFREHLCG
jgi:uncharacterized protein (TIGR02452 family)